MKGKFLMPNPISNELQSFSGKSAGWLFFGWILVLLFPLFNIIPRPAVLTGHPWKAELATAVFLAPILLIFFFSPTRSEKFFSPLREKPVGNIFLPLLLIFSVWSSISAFWSSSVQASLQHTATWFVYLLFFLLGIYFLRRFGPAKFLLPTLFAVLIVATLCLIELITMPDFTINVFAFRVRFAKYAELILTVSPLFWALSMYGKNTGEKMFFLAAGVFSWLTVMLSLSTGAFVAGCAGFIMFFSAGVFLAPPIFRRKLRRLAVGWFLLTILSQAAISYGTTLPATTDFISGRQKKAQNTSAMRIYFLKVSGQMIRDNPLLGVGANNYSIGFNQARQNYGMAAPTDPDNRIAEDIMVERAHNEYVQILAELGPTGFLLFFTLIMSFAWIALQVLRKNSFRLPPVLWAALCGGGGFLISSLFSSFSFRAIQNGLVFFLVLAIAADQLLKIKRRKIDRQSRIFHSSGFRPARQLIAAGVLVGCLLAGLAGKKALSDYFLNRAETSAALPAAAENYRLARWLDPENASAYLSEGQRRLADGHAREAAPLLRRSIKCGAQASVVYSYLTTALLLAGQPKTAEQTMGEAIQIYPHSVFARVRYAVLLEQNGRLDEAARQLGVARRIDPQQTAGWYVFVKHGSETAARRARNHAGHPPLMSLRPLNAMYAIRDEEKFSGKEVEKFALFDRRQ